MGNPYAGEVSDYLCCCDTPGTTPPDVADYVVSVNDLNGILTLAGGTGIEISLSGGTITISASGGGLVLPYIGLNFRIKLDGTIQVENTTTGLYHTIGAAGADGSAYFTMNDTGEA